MVKRRGCRTASLRQFLPYSSGCTPPIKYLRPGLPLAWTPFDQPHVSSLVSILNEIRDSGELIAALFFERTFGATVGKKVLPLAVALSGAGNVMVVTFSLV
jgi:hypothetical protein